MRTRTTLNERFTLDIDGTRQKIWLRTRSPGSLPVLVVQAGPGLPLWNEVGRWDRALGLEDDFQVAYWEQRGCGSAPAKDALSVTWATQQADLTFVLEWLVRKTGQRVLVVGVSLGATLALGAASQTPELVHAVVGISTDVDIPASDEAVYQAMVAALPRAADLRPPFLAASRFQARAQHLANLGSIESGKKFGAIAASLISSLVATYGPWGVPRVMGNLAAVQDRLLETLSGMNLVAAWPATKVPVYQVFGDNDLLVPRATVDRVRGLVGPVDRVISLDRAGHSVHFDRPREVRNIILGSAYQPFLGDDGGLS